MAVITGVINVTGIRGATEYSPVPIRGILNNVPIVTSTKYYTNGDTPTVKSIRAQMNINPVRTTTWNTNVVDITGTIATRNYVAPHSLANIYTTRVNQNGKIFDFNIVKTFGEDPVREFWM